LLIPGSLGLEPTSGRGLIPGTSVPLKLSPVTSADLGPGPTRTPPSTQDMSSNCILMHSRASTPVSMGASTPTPGLSRGSLPSHHADNRALGQGSSALRSPQLPGVAENGEAASGMLSSTQSNAQNLDLTSSSQMQGPNFGFRPDTASIGSAGVAQEVRQRRPSQYLVWLTHSDATSAGLRRFE
jgi:hypothetical protein